MHFASRLPAILLGLKSYSCPPTSDGPIANASDKKLPANLWIFQ
jgi:hypothetical protein